MKTKDFDFRLWHEQLSCFISYNDELNRIIPKDKKIELELNSGLEDKKGKKIYEGDIVKFQTQKQNHQGSVVFQKGRFTISFFDGLCDLDRVINLEVIGNIHENIELLKDK